MTGLSKIVFIRTLKSSDSRIFIGISKETSRTYTNMQLVTISRYPGGYKRPYINIAQQNNTREQHNDKDQAVSVTKSHLLLQLNKINVPVLKDFPKSVGKKPTGKKQDPGP